MSRANPAQAAPAKGDRRPGASPLKPIARLVFLLRVVVSPSLPRPPLYYNPHRGCTDHHRLGPVAHPPLLASDSPPPAPAWLPGPFADPSPAKARRLLPLKAKRATSEEL